MERLEWLEFRKLGLGGSDAPVIMNVSPWKNLLQLYNEKVSDIIVDNPPNYAQERGIQMEPRIRALYEILTEKSYEPALMIMEKYDFMRCSLDGKNENEIIEIKFSGKADWLDSKENGIVPKKYLPQIQHSLLVSGAEYCTYLSYLFSKEDEKILTFAKLAIIKVFPNPEYQINLLYKCTEFWQKNVLLKVPPI